MKSRLPDPLLGFVESFFCEYLQRMRGASYHTILSYRDSLRLFLCFLADSHGRHVSSLTLGDIVADEVLAFLEHIETKRGNSVATRNQRLAAIRSFTEHLLRKGPDTGGSVSTDPRHPEEESSAVGSDVPRARGGSSVASPA